MSKKEIMIREIKAIFIKELREDIEYDQSPMAHRSNTIMRICRGATLFVVVMSPLLNIINYNIYSVQGFLGGLIYTMMILFVLAPLLYVLFSMLFLPSK